MIVAAEPGGMNLPFQCMDWDRTLHTRHNLGLCQACKQRSYSEHWKGMFIPLHLPGFCSRNHFQPTFSLKLYNKWLLRHLFNVFLLQPLRHDVSHDKLLYFPGDSCWELGYKCDVSRDLEMGNFTLAKLSDLCLCQATARVQFHPDTQLLSHPFIRHSKCLMRI